MSTRETQFQSFAYLQFRELDPLFSALYQSIENGDTSLIATYKQRIIDSLARRAYDVMEHTLIFTIAIPSTVEGLKDGVPDITALNERQDTK